MPPKISLVIATYNSAAYVSASIGSVLAQTRKDFELLVWDDGSTDRTVEIARELAAKDSRVRVVVAEHLGNPGSLRAATNSVSGEYSAWLDADDAIAPTALDETAAVLDARPDVGLVYTQYVTMDENGRVTGVGKRSQIPYSKDRLLIDFMVFHFRLMRRSIFQAVGGINESMKSAEDYDLCLRISEVTEIHHIPRPLYFYRLHRGQISHNDRVQQIMTARDAILAALKRRKLDDRYELDVQIVGQFKLRPKT